MKAIGLPLSAAMLYCLFILSCGNEKAGGAAGAAQSSEFVFGRKPAVGIKFLSTQMNPVEEAGKMRNVILKDFPGKVDFRPNDNSYLSRQIETLLQANPAEAILIGALHGDLVKLYEEKALQPLEEVYRGLERREFFEAFLKLGRLNGKDLHYIPWMQASFVMAANKKALDYLPEGAVVEKLTYDQLNLWAKNIFDKTGKKVLGFPAGGKGLMHRFFQGYLYPSFTGSTLLKFRGPKAEKMWEYFKDLWLSVHPGSLVYSTMSHPLLTEEVWIAWDHTARLLKAFEERPDDFIAFPAPGGPEGRGFMPIVSGLAIPKAVKAQKDPELLLDYLTRPVIQTRTLKETGFFPVVTSGEKFGLPGHLRELGRAVDKQAESRDSIPTLLPLGLGERGNDYNNVFILTFSEIVLEGTEIPRALNSNAEKLQKIINEANAKSWAPDVSDARPCKIE